MREALRAAKMTARCTCQLIEAALLAAERERK